MNNNHVQLRINIFDSVEPVLVKPSVSVEQLFQDILHEFSKELDLNQRYTLLYDGKMLIASQKIAELGLPPEATLTFTYQEPGQTAWEPNGKPRAAEATNTIHLVEVVSGHDFVITALPALIGRQSQRDAETLAVDLGVLPNGDTVSRRHARLIDDEGSCTLVRLEKTNFLYVNGTEIAVGDAHRLANGDLLRFGEVEVRFEVKSGNDS